MRKDRSGHLPTKGFSAVEALVALLLLGLVLQGGWSVLGTFRASAEGVAARAQGLESVRTTAWILSREMEGGRPGEDWWTEGGDSLSLRSFRGSALPVVWRGETEVEVCFRGIRIPDPTRDSLLLLGPEGTWTPAPLLARQAGHISCREGEGGEVWTLPEGQVTWILARVFRCGSYHFSSGAFRYRGSRGGRRPLTLPNVRDGGFLAGDPTLPGVGWTLVLAYPDGGLGEAGQWSGRGR